MITAISLQKEDLGSNYTEVLIEPVYDYWHDGEWGVFLKSLPNLQSSPSFETAS